MINYPSYHKLAETKAGKAFLQYLLPDILMLYAPLSSGTPASVPIKHEYSVFQWLWQQGRLIETHEQEALQGQQDVPWLRRRGSKNSRKLLYFVEWAQECKMSVVFLFL